jgi:hypothetical protein
MREFVSVQPTLISCCFLAVTSTALTRDLAPSLTFDSVPAARFDFQGPVGERVEANIENWLLRAPQSNPGMIEMFRVRDRKPVPQLVPWAGEFVGKYLISAVQALRMSEDPRLRQQASNVVAAFIATQAEDGYLGPFPKQDRLLKNWDLWGHYHAILALTMWHEHSGDTAALAAARKAADLVCATYLDTGRRVFDAGDHEMNMSILTAMAMLHRLTGEPRYLRMAREVEKDWERAGDYLRAGLDGREFFLSPKPRWESLHDLQGLLEMYRITGEAKYREAFVHHWRSIRRWDRRNTGGFSSGEQATGNPYTPSAIETCCTVAWMALTIDYLRLTGDSLAADDLELATLNGGLGAQHPSGRWWTYNTPMDGVREASAHSIVFQARAGTPELNCCSVNAPRVLGMLSEWAVMAAPDGIVVNSYLPGTFTIPDASNKRTIILDHDYPRKNTQRVFVFQGGDDEWTLYLRIPSWSKRTRVAANFPGFHVDAPPASYVKIRRQWRTCDDIVLSFDMGLRAVQGANETAGKVALDRGPFLLAYDQIQNDFDEDELPAVDPARLTEARLVESASSVSTLSPQLRPWLTVEVPTADGRSLRLVDFASAGSAGTRYRSWLPAKSPPPPPVFTQMPPDAGRVPVGPVSFQWRGPRTREVSYRVEFSPDAAFASGAYWSTNLSSTRMTLNTETVAALAKSNSSPIYWRVVSKDTNGESIADVPPAWFKIDPSAPPLVLPAEPKLGPHGEMIVHSLRGTDAPQFGELKSAKFSSRDESGTEVNGRDEMLVYSAPAWPEEDFTVSVRVNIKEHPQRRIGQVFSAWAGGMDDPLRLVVDGGRLFARIEAGGGFSTPGAPVETGRWYSVAATKRGGTLALFVDGRAVGSCTAPEFTATQAQDCALGGNPHFSGNEFLAARFADFHFYAKPLSVEEIQAWSAAR